MSLSTMGLIGTGPTAKAIDDLVVAVLEAARVPGGALAVVCEGETVLCGAYGYSDLNSRRPMNVATSYPIASTTKAINATLIGILQDEGLLAWDRPVRDYIPDFCLADASRDVTLCDLVSMRTGLPRHDWLWRHHPMARADLVGMLRYLEPTAGFREEFQYNNLTAVLAGHVAEVVTNRSWEYLVKDRILRPLGMDKTGFGPLGTPTISYHENGARELVPSVPWDIAWAAPAGTAIHSTIEDMAKWVSLNLADAVEQTQTVISERSLAYLRQPQIDVGDDPSGPTTAAKYGLGWFLDSYNGHERVSHSGYLSDVSSDVSLFPECRIGIVSFLSAGAVVPARLLNEHVFDSLIGLRATQTIGDRLTQYEARLAEHGRRRDAATHRTGTSPSHPLSEHVGTYMHPGYGRCKIREHGNRLFLERGNLQLQLRHWHNEAWVAENDELLCPHVAHPFDALNPMTFETGQAEAVTALLLQLEPKLPPMRFEKQKVDMK